MMWKPWYFILGIGLLILWLVGLQTGGWLTWLIFVAGCLSIIAGFALPAEGPRSARLSVPLALAIGLYVLWIIGLAVGKAAWKDWWTFAFACAYLLLAVAEG